MIIGGGSVGCELADYLAPLLNDRFIRNRDITILEMAQEIMMTEAGVNYHLIGDGHKVGNIKDAILEGYQVGKEI